MKFNPMKGIITGAALIAALHGKAAEKPMEKIAEKEAPQTEMPAEKVVSQQAAAELEIYQAEQREMQIQKLEKAKTRHETNLQRLSGQLQMAETDFEANYEDAMDYAGKKIKPKFSNFEDRLAELALARARAEVATGKNVTNEAYVSGTLGALLSHDGPLGESAAQLDNLLQGQLGSTIMMSTEKPGKYISPDMKIHHNLGKDPKTIVETALNIAQEEHYLAQVTAELNSLLEVPTEIASN